MSSDPTRPPRWIVRLLRASALFGAALVVLLYAIEAGDPLSRVIAAAALVAVPLGLAILPSSGGSWNALLAIVASVQPIAGAAVLAALSQPVGRSSGLYCVPWMMLALLCAAMGIARVFADGGVRRPAELCRAAALLYLPVGAGWLVAWRGGFQLGFSSTLAALTAVHFHFSAFAAPLLAAAAIHVTRDRSSRIAAAAGLAIVAAQPIVAIGISVSPLVSVVGALLLALALVTLSLVTLFAVQRRMRSTGARVLACVSACAPLLSMPLAVLWSWGEMTRVRVIELEGMIDLHGVTNAYVFAIGGLVAWTWEARSSPD